MCSFLQAPRLLMDTISDRGRQSGDLPEQLGKPVFTTGQFSEGVHFVDLSTNKYCLLDHCCWVGTYVDHHIDWGNDDSVYWWLDLRRCSHLALIFLYCSSDALVSFSPSKSSQLQISKLKSEASSLSAQASLGKGLTHWWHSNCKEVVRDSPDLNYLFCSMCHRIFFFSACSCQT